MRLDFIHCRPAPSFMTTLLLLVLAIGGGGRLAAQTQDQGSPTAGLPGQGNAQCAGDIEAVPDRPSFSTTAETLSRGVFEIEYGFDLGRGHQNTNGLLKFGLSRNLEMRFGNNPFVRDAGLAGFGDSGAGFKYRFLKDRGALPTMSVPAGP